MRSIMLCTVKLVDLASAIYNIAVAWTGEAAGAVMLYGAGTASFPFPILVN